MPLFANSLARALREQQEKHRHEIEDLHIQLAAAREANQPQPPPQQMEQPQADTTGAPPGYMEVINDASNNDIDQGVARMGSDDKKDKAIFPPDDNAGPANGMQYVQPPPMVPMQQNWQGNDRGVLEAQVQQLAAHVVDNNMAHNGGCGQKKGCGKRRGCGYGGGCRPKGGCCSKRNRCGGSC